MIGNVSVSWHVKLNNRCKKG
jgi:hypothetical protein